MFDLSIGWEYTNLVCHILILLLMLGGFFIPISQYGVNHNPRKVNFKLGIYYVYFALVAFSCFVFINYIPANFLLQENPELLFATALQKNPKLLGLRLLLLLSSINVLYEIFRFRKQIYSKPYFLDERKITKYFKRLCMSIVVFFFIFSYHLYDIKNYAYELVIGITFFIFWLIGKMPVVFNFKIKETTILIFQFVLVLLICVSIDSWKLAAYILVGTSISMYLYFFVNPVKLLNKNKINWY